MGDFDRLADTPFWADSKLPPIHLTDSKIPPSQFDRLSQSSQTLVKTKIQKTLREISHTTINLSIPSIHINSRNTNSDKTRILIFIDILEIRQILEFRPLLL